MSMRTRHRTRNLRPAVAAVLVLAAAASEARAERQRYRFDPVHTRVAFQVDHAGLSKAIGTFSGATGTLDFDPDDWSTARVDVEVPIATLGLGDAAWERKVLDRTFFEADKFPRARFVSTRVEGTSRGPARVTGTLTLRGVAQPVVLEVDFNALKRHPLTFRRTAGFSARGQLSRKAFGIDAWERLVGDVVTLTIEAEAVRDGDATRPSAPSDGDTDANESAGPGAEPHAEPNENEQEVEAGTIPKDAARDAASN